MEQTTSDDEMDQCFTDRGYDGRWSLTTRLTQLALGAAHLPLQLNYLWAVTPQNYRCPICERNKPQLMRLVNQRLVAYLCIDHDHIMDYIAGEARRQKLKGTVKALYDELMSFPPLMVCNQCNGIDSFVKTKIPAIDRHFTFAPIHKRELFKLYRRSHHWINLQRAENIWHQEEAGFRGRRARAEELIRDCIGDPRESPWSYHRYIDEEIKARFAQLFPDHNPEYYSRFIRRSIS